MSVVIYFRSRSDFSPWHLKFLNFWGASFAISNIIVVLVWPIINYTSVINLFTKNFILLSSYMEYIESIGFTPKILKFFFCSNHVFYR
jgi:hypothetical protein